jgi:hypothetical protein
MTRDEYLDVLATYDAAVQREPIALHYYMRGMAHGSLDHYERAAADLSAAI